MKERPTSPALESLNRDPGGVEGSTRLEYEFEVISPVFGGGVVPMEPDLVTPIRGASIRGQLRFWWRATSPYGDLQSLREAEEALWGSTEHPSRVSLTVETQCSRPHPSRSPERDGVSYADFPLRSGQGQPEKVLNELRGAVKIHLDIKHHAQHAEADLLAVKNAMLAWITFGGLGGRNRRGFGALAPTRASCNPKELFAGPEKILEELSETARACPGTPSLDGAALAILEQVSDSGLGALDAGLDKLRIFRQGPGKGRDSGKSKKVPGKTRWPEASIIRSLRSNSVSEDNRPFPRAIFGMPIIFQNLTKGRFGGDPHVLPEDKDRRASPLIIRPFRKQDERFAALALVLRDDSRLQEKVVLQLGEQIVRVRQTLAPGESRWPKSPLDGNDDVLDAFLAFFAHH